MKKDLKFSALLGVYRGLLTEKQAEAMEYYYDEDLSLFEISEVMGVTRQGARDFIKRGETALSEAEEKLGLRARLMRLDDIKSAAEDIRFLNRRLANSRHIDALAGRILETADAIEEG